MIEITGDIFINEDELLVLFRDSKLAIINLVNSNVVKIDATRKFKDYKFDYIFTQDGDFKMLDDYLDDIDPELMFDEDYVYASKKQYCPDSHYCNLPI